MIRSEVEGIRQQMQRPHHRGRRQHPERGRVQAGGARAAPHAPAHVAAAAPPRRLHHERLHQERAVAC